MLGLLGTNIISCRADTDGSVQEKVELGNRSEQDVEVMIKNASGIKELGTRIEALSSEFLGTPYMAHTLTGNIDTPEIFTINLKGMDCYTYLDYVESMRLSQSYQDFEENLKTLRYLNGNVKFENRNHFFSDWPVNNAGYVRDVTREVGGGNTKEAAKFLNQKKDGSNYLPGIPVVEREITYIPSENVNEQVIGNLISGDYIGIYTEIPGLDVTHTGIVIKKGDRTYLRHASSKQSNQKVVDEDFMEYISKVPGIVVYRPLPNKEEK